MKTKLESTNSTDYDNSSGNENQPNGERKQELDDDELAEAVLRAERDPVFFSETFLDIHPYPYQKDFLTDKSKRIVICAGRRIGKSTMTAARGLWFALMNKNTTTLIISATLRQSMLMFDTMLDYVSRSVWIEDCVQRRTRTLIRFRNGSKIKAYPCGKGKGIRGDTAHLIICFPKEVKVLMADGTQRPINRVKAGEEVVSFNILNGSLETRRVVRTFVRTYRGPLVKISHDKGSLLCTPNHPIFSGDEKEKIPSIELNRGSQIWTCNGSRGQTSYVPARTVSLRRPPRRLIPNKNSQKQKKLSAFDNTFLKSSRVRTVEILANPRLCNEGSKCGEEFRLGKRDRTILHYSLSGFHKSKRSLLSERTQDDQFRMVIENYASPRSRYLVHGRRQYLAKWKHSDSDSRLLATGEPSTEPMATGKVENQELHKSGWQRERILSMLSRERQGRVLQPDQAVCDTCDAVQGSNRNRIRDLSGLRSPVPTKDKAQNEVLLGEMQSVCTAKVPPESNSRKILCGLRESVSTCSRESDHLQGALPASILRGDQKSLQIQVFNIEVEGNHNYFANRVLVANCDEAAFMPDDVIGEAILPMLATTDGTAIMLSTPYDRDHLFYKAFTSPQWSKYSYPTEINPTVKKEFLEEQRELIGETRFRQEYLGEFVEDERAYFSQSLIRACIHSCESTDTCEYCDVFSSHEALAKYTGKSVNSFYGGYDPGGRTDPAAFVVVEKMKDGTMKIVLVKTYLAHLHGKNIQDENLYTRFTAEIADINKSLKMKKLFIDQTGLGQPIVEQCKTLKLPSEGLDISAKTKEELLSNLKILFELKNIILPSADRDLELNILSNLNCIEADRKPAGGYIFSHPRGTHDDIAFALALAVWGASGKSPIIIMMKDEPPKASSWRFGEQQ